MFQSQICFIPTAVFNLGKVKGLLISEEGTFFCKELREGLVVALPQIEE
jgi:hypothetical protein